jgi:uncharacterized cupin superfamily protein
VVPEAKTVRTENGKAPEGEGWFVLNAREAEWLHTDALGSACTFEGNNRFPQIGINVNVLPPGQPNCMYHGENSQEDFLVLFGECLLLIEGQERRLKAWDFVHCPPWTEHVFVGVGTEACVLLAVGCRVEAFGVKEEILYPAAEIARKHGAGVPVTTPSPKEAYAPFPPHRVGRYREGDL